MQMVGRDMHATLQNGFSYLIASIGVKALLTRNHNIHEEDDKSHKRLDKTGEPKH